MYDIIGQHEEVEYESFSFFTIGDLLEVLDSNPDIRVKFYGSGYSIGDLHSWRGVYSLPAISYSQNTIDKTASDFSQEIKQSLQETHYCGWKGGDYNYDKDMEFYVSEEGNSEEYKVVKAAVENDELVLYTKLSPY